MPAKKNPSGRGASLEGEVFLALLRSADSLLRQAEELLKTAGLSHTQYNVLRILRGAGRGAERGTGRGAKAPGESAGLPCGEIAARMITRDPDITRLLDRLEARGLVARSRQKQDRRVVQARITPAGKKLLRELDAPVDALHQRQLRGIMPAHLQTLLQLLDEVRKAAAGYSE
jgi:DNA-binding MarR family transcriptional regulator